MMEVVAYADTHSEHRFSGKSPRECDGEELIKKITSSSGDFRRDVNRLTRLCTTALRQFQKLGEDRTSFTRETSRTVGPTYATRNHARPAHVVDKLIQPQTIRPRRLKRRRQSPLRRQRRQSPIRRQRRRSPLKMTAMSLYVVLNILSRSRRSRRVCWRQRCRFT